MVVDREAEYWDGYAVCGLMLYDNNARLPEKSPELSGIRTDAKQATIANPAVGRGVGSPNE
jgi:hypothetical protein